MLVGLVVGILLGLVYLARKESTVRRTLISSVLLGIVVGILVELARRPLFTAIFAGVATIFVAEFIRWVLGTRKKRSS